MRMGAVIPRYNLEKLPGGSIETHRPNIRWTIPLVLDDLLEAIQCAIVSINADRSVVLQLSANSTLVRGSSDYLRSSFLHSSLDDVKRVPINRESVLVAKNTL